MNSLYPDAPRFIPGTRTLLKGWRGPVSIRARIGTEFRPTFWNGEDLMPLWEQEQLVRLDPMMEEVRDSLMRRLNLPSWMRDGTEVLSWQSAGLISCAAAGRVPLALYLSPRKIEPDVDPEWSCASMLEDGTMALPWPGGPRIWRQVWPPIDPQQLG